MTPCDSSLLTHLLTEPRVDMVVLVLLFLRLLHRYLIHFASYCAELSLTFSSVLVEGSGYV